MCAQEILQANLTPLGFETIAGAAASTALPSIPALATKAIISVEDQDIRWRDDGVAPTTTVGILLQAGRETLYEGGQAGLVAFRLIELAVATEVNISYYQ